MIPSELLRTKRTPENAEELEKKINEEIRHPKEKKLAETLKLEYDPTNFADYQKLCKIMYNLPETLSYEQRVLIREILFLSTVGRTIIFWE